MHACVTRMVLVIWCWACTYVGSMYIWGSVYDCFEFVYISICLGFALSVLGMYNSSSLTGLIYCVGYIGSCGSGLLLETVVLSCNC